MPCCTDVSGLYDAAVTVFIDDVIDFIKYLLVIVLCAPSIGMYLWMMMMKELGLAFTLITSTLSLPSDTGSIK